ncbi:TonB-dependent receptor plug domain-containing protein [Desulfospira joergensenii]|uniref:TonB-dependent receptor plug domain-containing protein n=1 Tax=Desulfospira joergensenii TaxID=53329 RepID=UPI0003B33637|nr:TonB-dependent receptor [Desulfospira joergensenii]
MIKKREAPQGTIQYLSPLFLFFLFLIMPVTAPAQQVQGTAQDLGEITVIAEKIDTFIEQNPSQIVSMDAKEIETRNFLQVHEVLGSMAGVDVKQNSGGLGTRISIRGGGGSGSVLVLIDGRPASTMQYGGVDLSSIPIDIIKKITVFKPPVPVWLGPGSAAGAIYIETKGKNIRVRQASSGKVRLSAGSYGLVSGSATGRFDANKSQILVSGGYSHKDGRRDNSQKEQGHMSVGYDKKEEGRHLQINGKAFVSDHGVSGPEYNLTPNARQRYEKASLDLKYDGFVDSLDYTFKTWGDFKRLDDTANNGSQSILDTVSAGLGTDFFLTDESEKKELKIGGLAEHINVDHTLTGEHDRTRMSVHTETNIRTQPMVYTIGARAEYTNDFYFSPAGHAGVSYAASKDTVLKASAGYSEHVPSFGQLYQPSHGAVDQVRGNPDLDKEKIVSLTTGLEHRFHEKHSLSLSLFRTDTWDLIKYQRDSNQVSEPVNVDRAYKQGIETLVKFALGENTSIDAGYIWQDTKNRDNDKELSYAPEHTLKLIFKTKFKTGTRLEWTTRGYTKQYSDNLNTEAERIDPYLATDVKISHPVTLFEKKALVFANIHNLFDKDYSSHYGYPDDGIKLECGLSINF